MANIEDFIKKNREHFFNDEPSPDVWKNISQRVKTTKPFSIYLPIAASVFGLLIFGSIFFLSDKNKSAPQAKHSIESTTAGHIDSLQLFIDNQQLIVAAIKQYDPSLYNNFLNDLQRLQADQSVLFAELKITPNRSEIIKAIIRNLIAQIELLERQTEILETLKKSPNEQRI